MHIYMFTQEIAMTFPHANVFERKRTQLLRDTIITLLCVVLLLPNIKSAYSEEHAKI